MTEPPIWATNSRGGRQREMDVWMCVWWSVFVYTAIDVQREAERSTCKEEGVKDRQKYERWGEELQNLILELKKKNAEQWSKHRRKSHLIKGARKGWDRKWHAWSWGKKSDQKVAEWPVLLMVVITEGWGRKKEKELRVDVFLSPFIFCWESAGLGVDCRREDRCEFL